MTTANTYNNNESYELEEQHESPLVELPAQILVEDQLPTQGDELLQTQQALACMEEKFNILNNTLAQLKGTTLMLETELVKKKEIIENQQTELILVKQENE